MSAGGSGVRATGRPRTAELSLGPAARIRRAAGTLARTVFLYAGVLGWMNIMGYVLAIPVALVERLILRRESYRGQTILHRFIPICSLPWRLLSDVRIERGEMADEGRAVVICNHHSSLDPFLLLHLFPRIHFTARKEWFRYPIVGWGMTLFQHIPQDPRYPEQAIEIAAEWLRRGRTVGLLPEGTRQPEGVVGPFHLGAFRLAQQTTGWIQPVVLAGTGRVWSKNQIWIRHLGPVRVKVLPPVRVPEELDRAQLRALRDEIRGMMIREHAQLWAEIQGLIGEGGIGR